MNAHPSLQLTDTDESEVKLAEVATHQSGGAQVGVLAQVVHHPRRLQRQLAGGRQDDCTRTRPGGVLPQSASGGHNGLVTYQATLACVIFVCIRSYCHYLHTCDAHRCSMGRTNAAVLPEPVRAMPTTSEPASIAGMALR
jgi:hypothetical protein